MYSIGEQCISERKMIYFLIFYKMIGTLEIIVKENVYLGNISLISVILRLGLHFLITVME